MQKENNKKTEEKSGLHPSNKHRAPYDFKALTDTHKELKPYVRPNKYGDISIDFFDAKAVKELNKALLLHHYQLDYWDIPEGHLCPPIPGRADYIHYLADLILDTEELKTKNNTAIHCLDIGVGTNCIYPIIGVQTYGWTFVGVDIAPTAIASSQKIIEKNPSLQKAISLRLQSNPKNIFNGIVKKEDHFDITLCNPPFHASAEAAQKAASTKLKNLKATATTSLNFGGQHHELWCKGGELEFVKNMVRQSQHYSNNCTWFTCLISKKENIRPLKVLLKKIGVTQVKNISMSQGNKISRILAWKF